jgi:two-component system, NarL family, nitrate/nitrite response regulator NarL
MIGVFVISAVCLYREALTMMLARYDTIEIVGAAVDAAAAAAIGRAGDVAVDVVLLDVTGVDVGATVESLAATMPGARVVALTVPDREHELVTYAEAGVHGLVTVEASLDELVAAIETAARGEALCSPSVVAALMRRLAAHARGRPVEAPAVVLTRREFEIIELIDEGLSNKQIAQRLRIELPTVKNHVHHILEKLGVHRRGEAVALVRGRISREST